MTRPAAGILCRKEASVEAFVEIERHWFLAQPRGTTARSRSVTVRASRARHNTRGRARSPPGPFCSLRMLECTVSSPDVVTRARDHVSEESVVQQFTLSSLLPPLPSWQLEDRRLPHGSRICNPAACRTITREYVYTFIRVHTFCARYANLWNAQRTSVNKPLDYYISSRSFSHHHTFLLRRSRQSHVSPCPWRNFDQDNVVVVAVESPASRIPRTFTFS